MGVYRLASWVIGSATAAQLDADSATWFRAGGAVWAAFLAGSGVRTSWGFTDPAANLADVSPQGDLVLIPDYQRGQDLRVIRADGTEVWIGTDSLGQDAAAGPNVRLRDGILVYQAGGTWHVEHLGGGPIPFVTRETPINYMVPVTADGILYLLEREDARLTLRPAMDTHGWVLGTGHNLWSPDAVSVAAGEVLIGWGQNAAETPGSLSLVRQSLHATPEDLDSAEPVDPIDPVDPVDPVDPIEPIDPEVPVIPLPAKCFVLLHNSNIALVEPGTTKLELAWPTQEYGAWQEVEVTASKNAGKVLVRFMAANRLFRCDTVLAQQQHYEAAISETWDPHAPDADSGWQNGVPSGPFIHFLGPDVDHRTGIVYTLTCVDRHGKLFK
jgi:hypothetical protein